MSIDSSILVAASGLRSATKGLAVAAQNVANASTPSYATESVAYSAAIGGDVGGGVLTGPATINVDASLEASVFEQNGEVAAQQTTSDALSQIDATQGTTAAGNDIASEVGALSDAFSSLDSAQDSIVSDVATLNTTLLQIGALSKQIVAAQNVGQSTADLQNQRGVAESTAAQLAGIKFLPQSNGDVVALAEGNQINLNATTGPFAIANATLSPASTGPALTLAGQDVTSSVTSGSIGANLTLRDTTLPAGQAGLDEFAQTLATRLSNQGLQLFTDPSGAVPAGGGTPVQSTYVGFANVIQVNPAVTADNAVVRDGTNAVAAGTGGAAGFTPNPAGGPAGFTTLIDNVLEYGLGADAQAAIPQTAPATTGLGVNGTVTLSYQTSGTIGNFAANLVAAQSTAVNTAASALSTGTSLQSTLQSKLAAGSGVSIDSELSNLIILQNAYGANAKVLTAAQSLWTDLFAAVTAVQ
jgi:flagellar hook-associated protein 1 FlgK